MKRRRETEKGSEMRSAIEELTMFIKLKPKEEDIKKNLDSASVFYIPTKPFLCVSNMVLQVLDKIGPTMLVLRQDIDQNIKRLEMFCESDPSVCSNLVDMLKKEASQGIARNDKSCSRAFVWLTRSIDFTVALLQRLSKDPEQKMEVAVEEAYNITLKPWHKWISSAAFKVALKLVPDTITFINLLLAKDEHYETLKEEIQTLISLLAPLLDDIHSVLRLHDLDTIRST